MMSDLERLMTPKRKKNANKVRNAIFMEAKMQISKLAESKRKTRKIKDSKIEEDVTTFYVE